MTKPSIRAEILKNSEIVASIQSEPIVTVNLSHGGQRGYSAYEIWLQEGNIGSVQDYLNSLRGAGAESYVHEQIQAQSEWTVKHWLRKFPSVTIVDSGGNVVVGDIDYLDEDTVTLRFTAAFGGKAYLN